MEALRVSVRALVEFTLHGEDICPGAGVREMQEGMLGHQIRQGMLEGWKAEVPVSLTVERPEEELSLTVHGRMDAYRAGEVPAVEEIKLWTGRERPTEPLPAHLAQALVYAHCLCAQDSLPAVTVRVAYVRRSGKLVAAFEQLRTAAECAACFTSLLEPYLRRQRLLRDHRRARDASLNALTFPYDAFRPGQRELAAQVYTAIRLRRRLFASMPTGTGKSAATLFPALKALGLGLTEQVFYLTARTTQRQGPLDALARMKRLHLWVLVLDAKDRVCPARTLCHPDHCPRAKGHFLRDGEAIDELLRSGDWSPESLRAAAERYQLCPFEFSLALTEVADLVICDYNYALDPAVHIRRIFDRSGRVTLLVDEAHNLLSRVREMLGGTVDAARLRALRPAVGKAMGRKHPAWKAMGTLSKALGELPETAEEAGCLPKAPRAVLDAAEDLLDALTGAQGEARLWAEAGEGLRELMTGLFALRRAGRREPEEYVWIREGHGRPRLTAFVPDVAPYLSEMTRGRCGLVCFSATLDPLPEMRRLLGGEAEDACFSLPSPYPPEHLLVRWQRVNTRYAARAETAETVAAAIRSLWERLPGKYLVFFPSFAYLRLIADRLDIPEARLQTPAMQPEDCEAFLAPYRAGDAPVLSLCVLGGRFAEGIDLPGRALDGVVIVGVGLPTPDIFTQTLRAHFEAHGGSGFRFACQIPGMQKVAQAGGRVIRSEADRGLILLLDDRYAQADYRALLPAHWQLAEGSAADIPTDFLSPADPAAIHADWSNETP